MSIPLVLKPEHGYVVACLFGSLIVNQYMASGVMSARKKYDVKYPTLYATEADSKYYKEFNCVQRGHQNFLENYPTYLIFQVASAIQYPRVSAALGLTFLVGRVLYFQGYASGDPQKRYRGAFQYVGLLGMWGLTGKLAWDLIFKALKK